MISVVVLTEAGKDYGYGHLTRCLAIGQGFIERGIETVFYLRGDSDPALILKEFNWHLVDWINDSVDVTGNLVIVDSYYADENICLRIYKDAKKVLFIDDNNRLPYPGGFVLNSVIGAEKLNYPENPEVTYLLGPEYHPLRREFWDVPEKVIKEKVEKILITFGGSDMTNETPSVLKILSEYYPDLEKHVIIGNGFSNIDEIKVYADNNTILIFKPDAERMKQEMLECDVAISAAGQTIYELARVGVPSIIKKIVDNQENNIKFWDEEKCIERLNLIGDIKKFLNYHYLKRQLYNLKMKKIIDGKGVSKIVNFFMKNGEK